MTESQTADVINLTEAQRAHIHRKVLDWLIPVIIEPPERERL